MYYPYIVRAVNLTFDNHKRETWTHIYGNHICIRTQIYYNRVITFLKKKYTVTVFPLFYRTFREKQSHKSPERDSTLRLKTIQIHRDERRHYHLTNNRQGSGHFLLKSLNKQNVSDNSLSLRDNWYGWPNIREL